MVSLIDLVPCAKQDYSDICSFYSFQSGTDFITLPERSLFIKVTRCARMGIDKTAIVNRKQPTHTVVCNREIEQTVEE